MAYDTEPLAHALGDVVDPELGLPIANLGVLRHLQARRGAATVELAFPIANWPSEQAIRDGIAAVLTEAGFNEVSFSTAVMDEVERNDFRIALREEMEGEPSGGLHQHGPAQPKILQTGSTTRILGISSGKGGVGKSTVTVNLAIALAKLGKQVGILDADVYGFSIPKMLGCDHDPVVIGDMVIPTQIHGVRVLSMGFFVPDDQPVIWRGPMLHKAIEQFMADAFWGQPDFLLIDMPPGTGDVALTLSQVMPRIEIMVVTTPQAAAQRVAQRSAYAARTLKLSVRGVIENMSWFTGDDGTRYELFGAGGGTALAEDLGIPLLGQVPLVPALREGGDVGSPITVTDPEGEAAQAFANIAERVVAQGPARVYRRELTLK